MAKNTTPVAPSTTGKQARAGAGGDPRAPLATDMASARQYGPCSPAKGKTHTAGYKPS